MAAAPVLALLATCAACASTVDGSGSGSIAAEFDQQLADAVPNDAIDAGDSSEQRPAPPRSSKTSTSAAASRLDEQLGESARPRC